MYEKILLVDNSVLMQTICKDILLKADYDIVGEAADGTEAIEKFRRFSPDVVLLNIVMPDVDGILTLKKIKKINPDAKAIICSSMAQTRFITEGLMAGAGGFILKPFDADTLVSMIEDVLHKERVFNHDVLRVIHEQSINETSLLTQQDINKIIRMALKEKVKSDVDEDDGPEGDEG